MNKSINFCHYPHSMCNPALYCNAAYLVIYETTVDHINNDDIHVSTTDRSKLDSIEAIQEKLNNIDLSKYVTNDNVSSIVQDYVGTQNYLTEVPSYYTTDEELSNTMTGLATIDNVASILNNKYYTRSQIDELLRNRRNTDIHITDVDFDGSQLIITESDGSVYKTAVSFSGGYSSVTITIYKRSENKPEVPTGGDYDFDNNQFIATDLTEGWYANKSDEDDSLPLWMSQRIFLGKKKITEEDEDVPQNGEWSEPIKLSGNNSTSIIEKPVSASHVEVVYHKAIYNTSITGQVQSTAPNTPIGGSYDFTTKEFTVPHNPVDETDLWSTTVSNDSYTITNSDGTTQTIYYTWYFSIGSIGEGESDFTWTTPAVYGVDYTQVAYNMRFIAVDYSVLAQNVKFTTGDFQIIANNITLNSEQLTAIAKDVTIKSEQDLKLIANNVSIDTTGVANAIDKAEIVDKLMQQEGYSKELAEKIAENGTMQVKTGQFLMDSNVFVGNVSDELLIRVGDDVDMSVTDKLNEIQQDINQHKQNLIDSVNNATSDENITNKVTSVVATDDYIAAVANNVVLDTNDLEFVSNNVDIKTLNLDVLAKRVQLTTEFAGLVAKEIDINSALTTFHGDVYAKSFSYGEDKINQETGEKTFVPRIKFTKNGYVDPKTNGIALYDQNLTEDVPVIIVLGEDGQAEYVLNMMNLKDPDSGNELASKLSFLYYDTFTVPPGKIDPSLPNSVKISSAQDLKLYRNPLNMKLYKKKNIDNSYEELYTGDVWYIKDPSRERWFNDILGRFISLPTVEILNNNRSGEIISSPTLEVKAVPVLERLPQLEVGIMYPMYYYKVDQLEKATYEYGELVSTSTINHSMFNAKCNVEGYNVPYVIWEDVEIGTKQGVCKIWFVLNEQNKVNGKSQNTLYKQHYIFTHAILNIAKIIDKYKNTSCYEQLAQETREGVKIDELKYNVFEESSFMIFAKWMRSAYKSPICYFDTKTPDRTLCPEEMYNRMRNTFIRDDWENKHYSSNKTYVNNLSYFFCDPNDSEDFISEMVIAGDLSEDIQMHVYMGSNYRDPGTNNWWDPIPYYRLAKAGIINGMA